MKDAPSIDFLVAGGSGIGLGHIVRCASIAKFALDRGWRVRAFLEGCPQGRARWQALTGRAPEGSPAMWAVPARRPPQIVALDFPDHKGAWLDRLTGRNLRSLVIDDARQCEKADWILLPALHHACVAHRVTRSPGPRVLCGPRYAILPEVHRRHTPPTSNPRSSLLLSMGGADPHGLTDRVLPPLLRALARLGDTSGIDRVDLVRGPAQASPRPSRRHSRQVFPYQEHVGVDQESMLRLIARARLAVVGFGTTITELAWQKTPFLAVTHHDHDRAPSRDLEAFGMGRVLAHASTLSPRAVEDRIHGALLDTAWQGTSAEKAHAALEGGHGLERLFEELECGLTKAPRRAAAPQLGGTTNEGAVGDRF